MHFENLFFTPWSTYATNWNGLNDFGRTTQGSFLWSLVKIRWAVSEKKSFEWKSVRTHSRTDGRRTMTVTIAQSEHTVLRWAKNSKKSISFNPSILTPFQINILYILLRVVNWVRYASIYTATFVMQLMHYIRCSISTKIA